MREVLFICARMIAYILHILIREKKRNACMHTKWMED